MTISKEEFSIKISEAREDILNRYIGKEYSFEEFLSKIENIEYVVENENLF